MRLDYLKFLVLALGSLVLTACETTPPAENAPVIDVSQAQASTKVLGEQDGFKDQASNKMKAPYNQVYYFDFDRFEVHSDDVDSVKVQANYLVSHPGAKIRLEGNADERGSREYNIALGWKRAKAVSDILRQEGVASAQIAMVSFGKEKPVALGHDESSYQLNRRVNLIYEAK